MGAHYNLSILYYFQVNNATICEREIGVSCQRLSITTATPKQGNEIKKFTILFKSKIFPAT